MECYLGEIHLFPWNWVPQGWLPCDGSVLNTSQYAALYSLLGNIYGGQAPKTFALPDLRGRTPVHTTQWGGGSGYPMGQAGGAETVVLNETNLPTHSHPLIGVTTAATDVLPQGGVPATPFAPSGSAMALYVQAVPGNLVPLAPDSVSVTGGNPHANMQPYGVLNFCIASQGIYPPRP